MRNYKIALVILGLALCLLPVVAHVFSLEQMRGYGDKEFQAKSYEASADWYGKSACLADLVQKPLSERFSLYLNYGNALVWAHKYKEATAAFNKAFSLNDRMFAEEIEARPSDMRTASIVKEETNCLAYRGMATIAAAENRPQESAEWMERVRRSHRDFFNEQGEESQVN